MCVCACVCERVYVRVCACVCESVCASVCERESGVQGATARYEMVSLGRFPNPIWVCIRRDCLNPKS